MAQPTPYNGQLIIPAGYETLSGEFACKHAITSVIVKENATLNQLVFYLCKGLTSVVIHPGASIGQCAFSNCTRLTSVVIHPGARIGMDAFSSCKGLRSVVIHPGVRLGVGAFSNCTGLTSLVIPPGASIGKYAFYACTGLTSVVIHPGTSIGEDVFEGCTGLTSLFIICSEDEELTWREDAGRIGVTADKMKFIREDFFEKIINRIRLYLPSMGGRALEYSVCAELIEPSQGALMPSPITLRQLRFNNAAVVPLHQQEEVSRIAEAVLLVMEKIKVNHKHFLPELSEELWFIILSFLFYQKLGSSRFLMLMDSLKGGFMKRLAHSGRAALAPGGRPAAGGEAAAAAAPAPAPGAILG